MNPSPSQVLQSSNSFIKSKVAIVIVLAALMLAGCDIYYLYHQELAHATRNLLVTVMVLNLCLVELNNYYLFAALIQLPNLLLLLFFSLRLGLPHLFFAGSMGHLLVSAVVAIFYW